MGKIRWTWYDALRYSTVWYDTVQSYDIAQYIRRCNDTVRNHIIWHCTIQLFESGHFMSFFKWQKQVLNSRNSRWKDLGWKPVNWRSSCWKAREVTSPPPCDLMNWFLFNYFFRLTNLAFWMSRWACSGFPGDTSTSNDLKMKVWCQSEGGNNDKPELSFIRLLSCSHDPDRQVSHL